MLTVLPGNPVEITYEQLRELINYDPDTGIFAWRISPAKRIRAGDVAGTSSYGYRSIRIDGKRYQAHRLAWLYIHGVWPQEQIDHINGVRDDNRIANLRDATNDENGRNRSKQSNNTSGFKGVSWDKSRGKWTAHIMFKRKAINLGRFGTPEEAYTAYCRAGVGMFGEFFAS